jgi:hypothetical protein
MDASLTSDVMCVRLGDVCNAQSATLTDVSRHTEDRAMKLFHAPGFSSLADHIAMLEAGFNIDIMKVDIRSKQMERGGQM